MWIRFFSLGLLALFIAFALPANGQTLERERAFVWTPRGLPAFRSPTKPDKNGIRFADSLNIVTKAHEAIGFEVAQARGFRRVFYPFGGVDPLPIKLGARTVLSGGLEPFGPPRALESEATQHTTLETTAASYAKLSYLHVEELGYSRRKSVGQDFLALARHVFGFEVTGVRYFDDSLFFADTLEQVEQGSERFRHVEIAVQTHEGPASFFYVQSNMAAETQGHALLERDLPASASPVLFSLMERMRPDGLFEKAKYNQSLGARLLAAFVKHSENFVTVVGEFEWELRELYFANRLTMVQHDGPFGYTEEHAIIPVTLLRKAARAELDFHLKRSKRLLNRIRTFWLGPPGKLFSDNDVNPEIHKSRSSVCPEALRPWKIALQKRGPVPSRIKFTM